MIATVPSRNKVASSGRRKQQKLPDPVVVSDEESVEDESITRCVCGELHSIGLMVCCDQCEVWQHCECMGLEEQEIPEQYFCEQCKPSDHVEVKGYDKTRRYYKPSSPTASDSDKRMTKRRTTFNSREASISLEEVLAFRSAIEHSGMELPHAGEYHSIEDGITVLQDYDENETITTRQVRPKRQSKKSEKKVYTRRTPQQQSAVAISPPSPPAPTPTALLLQHQQEQQTPIFFRETSPPAKIRLPSHRMSIPEMNRRANQILEYICSIQVELKSNKRKKQDDDDEEENVKRRQLIDAQIAEAMSNQHYSAGTDEYDLDQRDEKENRRPTPILIPGKFDHSSSPSSSLSSASTIPLDDHRLLDDHHDEHTEKSVAEEALQRKSDQSSMEIMDHLTRQVVTFQRRFGSLSYHLEDAGNESDGPITRRSQNKSIVDRSPFLL
ncbi:uncharacterized protein EV154DRAFT_513137 [Mucor mucedo]|uniref:uncharacterized protein n=1 Tax=Mucor mucedo TaxID=29922 RepID=UPI002221103A|nr:uncharacterized protein EV154DRAFT_513137 [Mucor mucedo]KAI7889863.1 hypothetical protein EV154DRAFT_513137 [Mucor mucedo]